jgi:hypothetical protein
MKVTRVHYSYQIQLTRRELQYLETILSCFQNIIPTQRVYYQEIQLVKKLQRALASVKEMSEKKMN